MNNKINQPARRRIPTTALRRKSSALQHSEKRAVPPRALVMYALCAASGAHRRPAGGGCGGGGGCGDGGGGDRSPDVAADADGRRSGCGTNPPLFCHSRDQKHSHHFYSRPVFRSIVPPPPFQIALFAYFEKFLIRNYSRRNL